MDRRIVRKFISMSCKRSVRQEIEMIEESIGTVGAYALGYTKEENVPSALYSCIIFRVPILSSYIKQTVYERILQVKVNTIPVLRSVHSSERTRAYLQTTSSCKALVCTARTRNCGVSTKS